MRIAMLAIEPDRLNFYDTPEVDYMLQQNIEQAVGESLDLELLLTKSTSLPREDTTDSVEDRPIDLSGWNFKLTIKRRAESSTELATKTGEITDPSSGLVRFTIAPTVTALWPAVEHVYTIMARKPDNTVRTVARGRLTLLPKIGTI